ncbi:hypothetical protein LshimejAT787_1300920 [Lyophyllum shimeji]|uniref:Uncharacterized protein n=1 Tax=Lyophyllum shimeji TaxID=47721 RepID=A0A9P3PX22_LYOSH|nr:hypothetical protein LshimejAT787_1300920 [Lyophyllum shimeji]
MSLCQNPFTTAARNLRPPHAVKRHSDQAPPPSSAKRTSTEDIHPLWIYTGQRGFPLEALNHSDRPSMLQSNKLHHRLLLVQCYVFVVLKALNAVALQVLTAESVSALAGIVLRLEVGWVIRSSTCWRQACGLGCLTRYV